MSLTAECATADMLSKHDFLLLEQPCVRVVSGRARERLQQARVEAGGERATEEAWLELQHSTLLGVIPADLTEHVKRTQPALGVGNGEGVSQTQDNIMFSAPASDEVSGLIYLRRFPVHLYGE